MTFAKTFGQRHVLHFLDSHVDLFGCRVTAASPVGLRVTDGVHQLCLKSTDGCIQREDAPNSVAPEDFDPHPRLLLNGRGIHVGETFHALFPDGWREITLEMSQKPEGPGCWYISTPGFTHICPIGLFVKE